MILATNQPDFAGSCILNGLEAHVTRVKLEQMRQGCRLTLEIECSNESLSDFQINTCNLTRIEHKPPITEKE